MTSETPLHDGNEPRKDNEQERPLRKPWYKRYFSWLSLVAIAVIGYMLFFSDSSLMTQIAQKRTIDSLRQEIRICTDTAAYYRALNKRITSKTEEMERIVREYHNMNHPDEDVYIFEKETDAEK